MTEAEKMATDLDAEALSLCAKSYYNEPLAEKLTQVAALLRKQAKEIDEWKSHCNAARNAALLRKQAKEIDEWKSHCNAARNALNGGK